METVTQNGKTYVKASSVARELGYTADYVGQLCREEQVDCERVGRAWFVNEASIKAHKKNRYRSTAKKSKDAIEKTIKKSDEEQEPKGYHAYASARYESDESDLIPTTKDTTKKSAANKDVKDQEDETDTAHEVDTESADAAADAVRTQKNEEGGATNHIKIERAAETKDMGARTASHTQDREGAGDDLQNIPPAFRFDHDPYKTRSAQNISGGEGERATSPKGTNAPEGRWYSIYAVLVMVFFVVACTAFIATLFATRTIEVREGAAHTGYSANRDFIVEIIERTI